MKTLHTAILGILLSVPLHADPIDERRKVAVELAEASNVFGYDAASFRRTLAAAMEAEGKKRKVNPEETELLKQAMSEVAATVTRDRMISMFAEGYAKQLSLDELKGVLAFYKSNAGQAFLREQNAIKRETASQSNILVVELVDGCQARLNELKKEKSK